MSRLLDQLDDYFAANDLARERDRADHLHAEARGEILHRITRAERRELNRRLWRDGRKTMRDSLADPTPGKFFWRVIDYEALPIERLKPYLDPRAIEAAIAIAISMGLRELGGVQIEQDIGGLDGSAAPARRRSPTAAGRAEADHDRGRAPFHVAYDRRADLGGFARR
jgi:hypothetical protein